MEEMDLGTSGTCTWKDSGVYGQGLHDSPFGMLCWLCLQTDSSGAFFHPLHQPAQAQCVDLPWSETHICGFLKNMSINTAAKSPPWPQWNADKPQHLYWLSCDRVVHLPGSNPHAQGKVCHALSVCVLGNGHTTDHHISIANCLHLQCSTWFQRKDWRKKTVDHWSKKGNNQLTCF